MVDPDKNEDTTPVMESVEVDLTKQQLKPKMAFTTVAGPHINSSMIFDH